MNRNERAAAEAGALSDAYDRGLVRRPTDRMREDALALQGVLRDALNAVMSEDDLLSAIYDAAVYMGWRVHHDRRSDLAKQQGHTGFPDLVLAKQGRVLFLELKRQDGRLSPDQDAWIAALGGGRLDGADGWVDVLVVRPADLDYVLHELGWRP